MRLYAIIMVVLLVIACMPRREMATSGVDVSNGRMSNTGDRLSAVQELLIIHPTWDVEIGSCTMSFLSETTAITAAHCVRAEAPRGRLAVRANGELVFAENYFTYIGFAKYREISDPITFWDVALIVFPANAAAELKIDVNDYFDIDDLNQSGIHEGIPAEIAGFGRDLSDKKEIDYFEATYQRGRAAAIRQGDSALAAQYGQIEDLRVEIKKLAAEIEAALRAKAGDAKVAALVDKYKPAKRAFATHSLFVSSRRSGAVVVEDFESDFFILRGEVPTFDPKQKVEYSVAQSGDSGGPLYRLSKDGIPTIYGICSSGGQELGNYLSALIFGGSRKDRSMYYSTSGVAFKNLLDKAIHCEPYSSGPCADIPQFSGAFISKMNAHRFATMKPKNK